MKKLLIDPISTIQLQPGRLLESFNSNNGRLIVSGTIQRADKPNQNKRIYPRAVLDREADRYLERIKDRRSLGELDHPDSNIINLKNVSHVITEIWWDNNDLKGNAEILDTPSGRILKEIINAGCTVGISSRGFGSTQESTTEEDGETVEVLDDFELMCWDFVSDPSTHGAYMRPGNISESKNVKLQEQSEISQLLQEIICDLSGVCCLKVAK